jgi:phosphoglycolate phosphatase
VSGLAWQGRTLRAAIVDLDGTLVDTLHDFVVVLNATLAELGQRTVDADFVARSVGKGSEHLIRATLGEVGAPAALYEDAWTRY